MQDRHYFIVSLPKTDTQEALRRDIYHTFKRGANVISIEGNLKEENFILRAENDRLKTELEGRLAEHQARREKAERTRLANLLKKYGVPATSS